MVPKRKSLVCDGGAEELYLLRACILRAAALLTVGVALRIAHRILLGGQPERRVALKRPF